MIMDERSYGTYKRAGQGGSESFYSGYRDSAYRNDPDSSYYVSAAAFLRNRRFGEALHVLDEIKNRNGRWYYYSAVANAGLGNQVTAGEHIRMAMKLEPDNAEYRQAYMQMQQPADWYSQMGHMYGMPAMNTDDMCISLCLANLFCNLCCRC
jgi:molecular chaperone DnaJ